MAFRVTIDQIAQPTSLQRYGPFVSDHGVLREAVADALRQAGLAKAEHGHYQITVTDTVMSVPYERSRTPDG